MAALRELKGRITSVRSSEKITSAMKMISSAKLRKAEQALKEVLPYKYQLHETLSHLTIVDSELYSPLMEKRDVKHVAYVIFGSNEGLCGAFNVFLYKKLIESINWYREQNENIEITVYPVGKKVISAVSKTKGIQVGDTSFVDATQKEASVGGLIQHLSGEFLAKRVDKVEVIYTHFKSAGTQIVKNLSLLPVNPNSGIDEKERKNDNKPYIFEPDSKDIFETIMPLYLRSILMEAWLENLTSEQAARIMSMQIANDNASKLMDSLQLEYNKLRQQNITTELLDILGGKVE